MQTIIIYSSFIIDLILVLEMNKEIKIRKILIPRGEIQPLISKIPLLLYLIVIFVLIGI